MADNDTVFIFVKDIYTTLTNVSHLVFSNSDDLCTLNPLFIECFEKM